MTTPTDPGAAAAPTPAAPVCPRHPDRVSYVTCQRCGRPACPECQRPAAVGIHCVDCVREAARRTPATRTVLGGTVRGGRPVVTMTIIGLNVVSYVLQLVVPGWQNALIFAPSVGDLEPYRFLTAAFLHASIPHIAFNMIALWFIGPYLEIVLGRWRYIALYLLSALGGDVMVLLVADPYGRSWVTAVLGASGAIFGLFGAVVLVARRLGQSVRSMFVVIVLNLVMSFTIPGISWQGHIGGLVVGLVLGAVFAYAPRPRQRQVALAATVATGVALVVVVVLRYASIGA